MSSTVICSCSSCAHRAVDVHALLTLFICDPRSGLDRLLVLLLLDPSRDNVGADVRDDVGDDDGDVDAAAACFAAILSFLCFSSRRISAAMVRRTDMRERKEEE